MNISNILLYTHIFGAFSVSIFILLSFYFILKKESRYHIPLAVVLAANTALQFITGSALTLLHQNSGSASQLCGKIIIYLFAVSIIEVLLFNQLYPKRIFPLKTVLSLIAVGLLFVYETVIRL